MEEWKQIFDSNFYVSNLGRVKLEKNGIERYVKIHKNNYGHQYVTVYRRRINLPRMIAMKFLPPAPPEHFYIRRHDGNVWNNRADNLYWSTSNAGNKVVSRWTDIVYESLKRGCEAEDFKYQTELVRLRDRPHMSNFKRV